MYYKIKTINKLIITSVKNESFNDFCDNYLFSKYY